MVKIKSLYLSAALIILIALASIDVIFMKGAAGAGLYVIYAVILSLAGYAVRDARMEKKYVLGAVFLTFSFAAACAAQYIFSFHHIPSLWIGALFLAAALLLVIASRFNLPAGSAQTKLKFGVFEGVMLGVILAAALFLRLYMAGSIPPGIWFDEAQNGNEVLRILGGKLPGIFIPRLTMMPALYFYIAAFFTQVFGVNIEALRLVSVVAGVLSVAAFYFLCRHIFRDVNLALAGAFLLATSRWHITFSRVAFLGMLTLLLVIVCFYYYLMAMDEGKKRFAVLSGVSMGLGLYTFSGANFAPIVIIIHLLSAIFKPNAPLFKKRITAGLTALVVAGVIASPLAVYAFKNPDIFSKRFSDLSITNEIEKEKSLAPLAKSAVEHLLMFNFEGDYNGRHNLYKKPMLDMVTGVLFISGFFAVFAWPGNAFYIIWFFAMLSAGILTISIEAPQSYRIIGILPVIYIFVIFAVKKLKDALGLINRSQKAFNVFLSVLILSAASLSVYQYFVLYPADKATYLSFSPEANAIAGFVKENAAENLIFVTRADSLYGFYPWEQKLICDFVNYKGPSFEYIKDDNIANEAAIGARKGVILLLRPSDTAMIAQVEKEYPKAVKKEFPNSVTDEIMFVCYYIEKGMIKKKAVLLHG